MQIQLPTTIRERMKTAPLPVNYTAAKNALAQCENIDECKDWADKSTALASYARQLKDPKLEESSRRIQLRAKIRIGELLANIPHVRPLRRPDGKKGALANPAGRAFEAERHGISRHEAQSMISMARLPRDVLEKKIESSPPVSAFNLSILGRSPRPYSKSPFTGGIAYREAIGTTSGGGISSFHQWIRKRSAPQLAEKISTDEAKRLRTYLTEIIEWLDAFEQHLPKSNAAK